MSTWLVTQYNDIIWDGNKKGIHEITYAILASKKIKRK
jgi:hypothetical protein